MPVSRFAARLALMALLVASAAGGAARAADASADTAARLSQSALTDPFPYRFLESLTTDIGERLAGTEAHARAVAWAENQLKAAGFANVHSEAFPMTAWIRGAESAQVIAPVPQSLAITGLGGSVATPAGGIDAEVALFRTYAELLDTPMGVLKGKIVVMTQHMAMTPDGSGYGPANPLRRMGASEAAKRGAIAYLVRSLTTDTHRTPHTGALNYTADAPRIPAAALSNPDADQLERLAVNGPVRIHFLLTPTENPNAQSWNVVGEVKGSERPDEIVLLGAHLDSWDLATGATDDGAGVAIVTGAGRLIAALPRAPKRTVRVVLFGAEEMDYSGPAYAKAHAADAGKIVLAGESDFGARNVYMFRLPPGMADTPFAATLERTLIPLGIYFDRTPALQSGDDVRGLAAAGVPMLALRQDGRDYFDTHHSADDTFDKIDPKLLAQAVGAWAAAAYLAADSDADFRAKAAAR